MKRKIQFAFVFVGTIIGAGLASGQEILQFFSLYGIRGYFGIAVCCVIYISISTLIVNLCFKHRFKSYRDLIVYALGKKLGAFVDIFLTLFIFGGNTIMLSGGGAMLNEYLKIETHWGIFIMALISFITAAFSTKGVIAINLFIVPLSLSTILIMGFLVFHLNLPIHNMTLSIINSPVLRKDWLISSLLYAAFNLMCATGVICPMILECRDKKSFTTGCTIGSLILTLITMIINTSILIYSPKSFYNEIPNLFIAKSIGSFFSLFLTIIIWLEMYSTEIGNLYSLGKRLEHSFKMPYKTSLLLVVLFSIPVSFIGFSNLIRILYPSFGAVSLVFILGCIIKKFKKGNEI